MDKILKWIVIITKIVTIVIPVIKGIQQILKEAENA
jgi:hypothetical protein